jgi:cytochrome c-type biogenesis protein
MVRLKKAYILFILVVFLLFIRMAYSTRQVVIEFLYWDPSQEKAYEKCPWCFQEVYDQFLDKNGTINRIQNDYQDQVLINRTEYNSPDGQVKRQTYKITAPNSIAIKSEEENVTIVQGFSFNETYIREVIDAYLTGTSPLPSSSPLPLIAILASAFSFGFLETFSPCLIILLSFALSYTIGKTTRFKEGLLQVMTFGIGFVSAAVLLGITVVLIFFSLPLFQNTLTWIVCIFAILFGLNLLGFNILKFLRIEVKTKPMIQKLARKYVFTYTGLILLGFLFYFLDPCLAPIFFAMMPLLTHSEFLLILLVFCLGVILPFIGIGILAGSISQLARSTYRHQTKIRAVSGLILIAYTLYLIVFYLIL